MGSRGQPGSFPGPSVHGASPCPCHCPSLALRPLLGRSGLGSLWDAGPPHPHPQKARQMLVGHKPVNEQTQEDTFKPGMRGRTWGRPFRQQGSRPAGSVLPHPPPPDTSPVSTDDTSARVSKCEPSTLCALGRVGPPRVLTDACEGVASTQSPGSDTPAALPPSSCVTLAKPSAKPQFSPLYNGDNSNHTIASGRQLKILEGQLPAGLCRGQFRSVSTSGAPRGREEPRGKALGAESGAEALLAVGSLGGWCHWTATSAASPPTLPGGRGP